jgi:hypothetical protein
MSLINRTLKIKYVGIENIKDASILAVWHQTTFVLGYANPFKDLVILTSTGVKGDIFTGIVKKFGSKKIIRASFDGSPKKSANATMRLLKSLQEGYSTVIALDGPKGPLFKIKPGIFYLSEKSGKKIVPVGIAFSKKLTVPFRWDKYIIPLPYSKVVLYLDNTYKGAGDEQSLKEAMFNAQKKAESMIDSI